MVNANRRREVDSDYIWKWICRLVVLVLIFYWVLQGLEPTERWIGLIVILLGLNEFSAKKDKHGKGFSLSIRQNKELPESTDDNKSGDPPVSVDRTSMVAWCRIRFKGKIRRKSRSGYQYCGA